MRQPLGWAAWENHVNHKLGLRGTLASGSQAHDPGDGTDYRHHSETDYALQVDAKYTEKGSFSVNARLMGQWLDRARAQGKTFALPIRFWPPRQNEPTDWVVIPFEDYVALVEEHRAASEA